MSRIEFNIPTRIYRPLDACKMLGVSKSSLYRFVRMGELGKPIKIGKIASGWREETLMEFINSRPSAR